MWSFFRDSTLEVTKGIREYFNISLGLQLLYKWERPQFIQIMNDNPETLPSQLYGAFHLLRLFGIIFYSNFVVAMFIWNLSRILYDWIVYSETRRHVIVHNAGRKEYTIVVIPLSRFFAIFTKE